MKLSIIVPCYNEEGVVGLFYEEAIKHIQKCECDYELIFVNDGSKDKTVEDCLKIKEKDEHIIIVDFSRNFGKEAAMLAGLETATGDLVVLMDADLQDPPILLPEMIRYITEEGYDSVATCRVDRKGEPPIRSWFARQFYKLINKMTEVEIVDGARDYRMMTRDMVNAIISMSEVHRFSKGIFTWVGFETKYLEFENVERVAGETKWSFWKLFKYAIEGIVAFTTFPLRMATILGFLMSFVGFVFMMYIAVKAILFGDPVAGYPSLIVVITLIGGIQLLVLGVMGEYLAKTYMEVKARPKYIVKRKL
ncbi:MAG: glycosyltransferase family 2 protein [Erysipelotrichaceae bacterium]|nr:glycosyltransferase family 2 protein [Erysipelotrichaceae bacterium]